MRALLLVACVLLAGCAAPPEAPADDAPPAATRVLYAPDCGIASPKPRWTEPCVALASPNPSQSKTEVDVAANPRDPRNVIVASKDLDREASADCVWSVAQWSKDGGRTWTTSYVGGKRGERAPGHPLFGWACVTDPILLFDQEGVAYYALQAYDLAQRSPLPGGAGSAIYLARSTDGGETWPRIILLHAGDGTAAFHDYMRGGVNPKSGTVYVAWNQISVAASEVVVAASRDGGETAAPPTYVPIPGSPAQARQTGIAGASDGTVYLLAMGGVTAPDRVFLARSTDDGRTFSPATEAFHVAPVSGVPNAAYRVGTFVELAVDASGGERDGCLYAAWADAAAGDGDADILLRSSCDQGASWTEPVRVNRDLTATDQFMPRIVVDRDGTILVHYATRGYDPANRLVDAEVAYSLDGGATWATKRLTTVSSDGDKGVHQNGFPFFGDYVGLATAGGRAYAAFSHTGTGHAEIAVAAIERAN